VGTNRSGKPDLVIYHFRTKTPQDVENEVYEHNPRPLVYINLAAVHYPTLLEEKKLLETVLWRADVPPTSAELKGIETALLLTGIICTALCCQESDLSCTETIRITACRHVDCPMCSQYATTADWSSRKPM